MTKEIVEKEELYNFNQLRDLSAGNREFIKSLAAIFVIASPVDSAAILNATKSGDWDTASNMAHKLKSTIDNMNISSIKGDVRTIEMDAKYKTNITALPELALKVDRVINEVAEQVRNEFGL